MVSIFEAYPIPKGAYKLPRSSNAVEGWHNSFNNSVGIAHPTPATLAKKTTNGTAQRCSFQGSNASIGQPAAKKRKQYKNIDDALYTMVNDYRNRNEVQYLPDVSRVLNINVVQNVNVINQNINCNELTVQVLVNKMHYIL